MDEENWCQAQLHADSYLLTYGDANLLIKAEARLCFAVDIRAANLGVGVEMLAVLVLEGGLLNLGVVLLTICVVVATVLEALSWIGGGRPI